MELVGAKSFVKTINIPSIALNKVTVATNCVLSEDEITKRLESYGYLVKIVGS